MGQLSRTFIVFLLSSLYFCPKRKEKKEIVAKVVRKQLYKYHFYI